MSDTPHLLLIESSAADRDVLHGIASRALPTATIHQADSAETAGEIAGRLDRLEVLVIGWPEEANASHPLFDLRDRLATRFGPLAVAHCGTNADTLPHERVDPAEMIFFKPVGDEDLGDWLGDLFIAPEPPAAEADSTEPLAPPAADELPEGLLPPGTQLGDYRLLTVIQHDDDLAMYEAEQTSIGRKVALKTLFRRHRRDPEWVGHFAHEARSRALVSHPGISLVYEADQDRGVTFYTLELIAGHTLSQLAAAGESIDEPTLWRLLKTTADVLRYLRAEGMEFRPLSADNIFLVGDSQPRIANPIKPGLGAGVDDHRQMTLIADAIQPFLRPGNRADKRLVTLLERMRTPGRVDGIRTADGLAEAIRKLEDEALKPEPAEVIEQRDNRAAVISGVTIGGLIVVGLLIWYFLIGSRPEAREFETLIRIPEGPFVYQEGEQIELPAFWIDEYEVTIAQYAEFLAAIAAEPALLKAIRHPDQPDTKLSHEPAHWHEILAAAIRGGRYKGADIDPNCPVTNVDWWDAYAYARWRGNRLPTEQEWEKAARGLEGNLYPWGDALDLARFNSGAEGNQDGHPYWAPVDGMNADESRYGVRGMAGNVSEWTATWDSHPDFPDQQVPMRRGASFANKENFELTARRPAPSAGDASLSVGFRTARSDPPPPPGTPPQTPDAPEAVAPGPDSPDADPATTPAPAGNAAPPAKPDAAP